MTRDSTRQTKTKRGKNNRKCLVANDLLFIRDVKNSFTFFLRFFYSPEKKSESTTAEQMTKAEVAAKIVESTRVINDVYLMFGTNHIQLSFIFFLKAKTTFTQAVKYATTASLKVEIFLEFIFKYEKSVT